LAEADDLVATAEVMAVSLTPERSTISPDTTDVAVANRGRSVFDHQATAGVYTTATIMDQEQFVMDTATQSAGHGLDENTVAPQSAPAPTGGGPPLRGATIQARHALPTSA